MQTVLLIAFFGAAGCIARYYLSGWVYSIAGTAFPFGTFAVNVAGAFLIGLIMEASLRSTMIPPSMRIGLAVGFLGGLTTFSTFSFETFRLLEEGQFLVAAANVLCSVIICLGCTWLGIAVVRNVL